MLLKIGVSIAGIVPALAKKFDDIDRVFIDLTNEEAVVTCGTEGTHMPGGLHPVGRAIDLRLPGKGKNTLVTAKLVQTLGPEFDVVLEPDHIHVEHDPKNT